MDAWEILVDNSTLTSGDAWEHLNNQEGGGAIVGEGYILVDTLEVELMSDTIDVEVTEAAIEVEVSDDSLDCEVLNDVIDVEVD